VPPYGKNRVDAFQHCAESTICAVYPHQGARRQGWNLLLLVYIGALIVSAVFLVIHLLWLAIRALLVLCQYGLGSYFKNLIVFIGIVRFKFLDSDIDVTHSIWKQCSREFRTSHADSILQANELTYFGG